MDQHWDTTLVEFIPQIVEADNAVSYNLAFKELTTRLNDSHAYYSSSTYWDWDGNYYPPFQLRFIENETVISKVLDGNIPVSVGDVIKEIDGHNIYELRDSLRRFAHGSNDVIIEKTLNSFISWDNFGSFQIKLDFVVLEPHEFKVIYTEHSFVYPENTGNFSIFNFYKL